MAFLLDAVGDYIDFGSIPPRFSEPFTILFWVYPFSAVNGAHLWYVGRPGSGTTARRLRINATTGVLQYWNSRGATPVDYTTSTAILGSGSLNKWNFVACSFDRNASAGSFVHIYYGDLSTPAVEASYSLTQDGEGDSSIHSETVLMVGNGAGWDDGGNWRLGCFGHVDSVLTLEQIRSWQFRPRVLNNMLHYVQFGYQGASAATDLSGNGYNSVALVGVELADHVPLGPPFGFDVEDDVGEAPVVQYLVPDADDVVGAWTTHAGGTTNLYQQIDEEAFNDGDYIRSPETPATAIYRCALSNPVGTPGEGAVIVRYRIGKSPATDSEQIDFVVRLKQGSTTIATWTHDDVAAFQTYAPQLTTEQKGNITDYGALLLEVEANTP